MKSTRSEKCNLPGPGKKGAGEKSDMGQKEIGQKSAALLVQYSHLSVSRSVKSNLPDNGTYMEGICLTRMNPPSNHLAGIDKKGGTGWHT